MTTSPPLISVCVANYNGAEVIEACLASIFAQTGEATFEVLVHDDASTDRSVELILGGFPKVELVTSAENIGFCRSNNALAAVARGQYLLLLNNDAWLEEGALATFLSAAQRYGESILTLPQRDAQSGELLDCGMFMDVLANPIPIQECKEQEVAMVMGACLWLPRTLWATCGGFPEWFESIAEDMYLCNYARLLGRPVVALAESAYHHHVGHSFGGGKVTDAGLVTTVRRRRLSERNKLYVMFLFYPVLPLALLLPALLSTLLIEGLLLALIKRDASLFSRIYGHALKSFFQNLPQLRRERAAIQARRAIGSGQFLAVFRWAPYKLTMLFKHGLPTLH